MNATETRIKAAKAAKNIPTAILLKKKSECDTRALKIVERLMEPGVEVKWMLDVLGQINRSHLEDVVDERAIEKICGYVLCDNELTKVVNKKYHISTSKNKIYNVEKVKNFCSFTCYSAMNHLMMQMLTNPLWLRSEKEIPQFTLLPKSEKRTRSPPGVEVNIMGIELPNDDSDDESEEEMRKDDKITRKKNLNKVKQNSSRFQINSSSLRNKVELSYSIIEKRSQKLQAENVDYSSYTQNKTLENSNVDNTMDIDVPTVSPDVKELNNLPESVTSIIDDIKSIHISQKPTEKAKVPEEKIEREKSQAKSVIFSETLAVRLEKSFNEWITKDTLSLLYGNETEKEEIIKKVEFPEKYTALCQRLDKLQFESEEQEATIMSKNLRPAPHYIILKDQAQELEIKARAFYDGQLKVETCSENSNKQDDHQESNTVIPLTDAHNPRALRRRIFLDKLNRILPDVLQTLTGLNQAETLYTTERVPSVKTLISTFNLTAKNIVFKTTEWTLVSLLIIKILGLVDSGIESSFSTKNATMYSSMILMSYKLDSDYLNNLIDRQLKFH